MHIPDGVLDPRVTVATSVAAAGGLAWALRRVGDRHQDRAVVLMGSMAAFVFAAQMVNFPLGPLSISGHLMGGVLAAALVGPWAGAVVIAAVLLVQCFLFGDGGLTALGANFLNMGLVGSVLGFAIYDPLRRAIGGRAGVLVGAMAAAWFSVILASGAFAIELAASGRGFRFLDVLSWMALVHAGIGVGEAVITGLVLRSLLLTRPDLIEGAGSDLGPDPAPCAGWFRTGLAGLGVALAVAIFVSPWASEHADGLETVGDWLRFLPQGDHAIVHAPIPDYALPGLPGGAALATAAAGAVGTMVVFGVGWLLARGFARGGSTHAA